MERKRKLNFWVSMATNPRILRGKGGVNSVVFIVKKAEFILEMNGLD